MKKTQLFILFGFLALTVSANPILLPRIEITELFFDPQEGYQIEVEYFQDPDNPVDSIVVMASQGEAAVRNMPLPGEYGYWVITSDSLQSELSILQTGDRIKIKAMAFGESDTIRSSARLIFGDYPKAAIGSPAEDYSIAKMPYEINYEVYTFFSKDITPTIGTKNDTAGMCGTLKGRIFNLVHKPVKEQTFALHYPFKTDGKGRYSARLLSNRIKDHSIWYKGGGTFKYAETEEFDFTMNPGELINLDIYLLDTLHVGIRQMKQHKDYPVSLYPNPVNPAQGLHYICDFPFKSARCMLQIVSMSGQVLLEHRITQRQGRIELPAGLADELFIAQILLNGQPIHSSKIIVHRP